MDGRQGHTKRAWLREYQFLTVAAIAAGAYTVWRLRTVVLVIFLSFLITTVMFPIVALLKRRHMPTVVAVLLPVAAIIGLLGLLAYLVLPPFISSLNHFARTLPALINHAAGQLHVAINTSDLSSYITGRFGSIGRFAIMATARALALAVGAVSTLVMTIYWLGSYTAIRREILALMPAAIRQRADDIWTRTETKLRLWIRAHLVLNTVVGLLVWLSMRLLGIPFAEVLGLIAFLVEIIPTAGPIIAAVPAVLLGLSQSVLHGIFVVLLYAGIQQLENHILAPLLLGKTVRLHPLVIIIALLVGYELYGVLGALIAVPVALCISSVVDSYRNVPQ